MNKKRIAIALALLVVIIIASILTYTLYKSNNKKPHILDRSKIYKTKYDKNI